MELYIQASTFTPVSVKSPCEKMKYCAVQVVSGNFQTI